MGIKVEAVITDHNLSFIGNVGCHPGNEFQIIHAFLLCLAIAKLQGRHFKPFLMKFPLFPIKKGTVADKEIKMKMGGCSEESKIVRAGKETNKLIRSIQGMVNKEEKEEILT